MRQSLLGQLLTEDFNQRMRGTAMAKATKAKAETATKSLDPEVLPAEELELRPIDNDASEVRGFLGLTRASMVTFVRDALALEQAAKDTLALYQSRYLEADGKTLVVPDDQDDDELAQKDVLAAKVHVKDIEAKWEITSVISRVHRTLTAIRGRGVKYATDARDLAQRAHNEYAAVAQRAAAAETERLRRAEEQRLREEQAAEAQRLEDEALKLEAANPNLSPREQRFVDLVANNFNSPNVAARAAGYKNPDKEGARLIGLVKIVNAIEAKRAAASVREQATAVRQTPVFANVAPVKAAVTHQPGHYDKKRHIAEVVDAKAFVAAVIAGGYGIPFDCLQPNEAKLAEYAKSLEQRIAAWPGIRYTTDTKTI